jgi:cell division protein FtsZ
MLDAFGHVDDILLQAVQGIIDLITAPGLINLDFADIRSVMKDGGPALIGLGRGAGEHRATDAARQALASPLLEASIEGARGILFNISGPADLRLREVQLAADEIRKRADVDANIIFGASFSESLGEDVLITLIATGLDEPEQSQTTVLSNGGTPPTAEAKRLPTRSPRAIKAAPGVDAVASAGAISDGPSQRSPAVDEEDLEVPSFLRQKGRPGSPT